MNHLLCLRVVAMIKLNVGGFKFCTSSETLKRIPDTYFSTLLSARIPSTKDDEGAFFVDRDGQYFAPILTYLRTGEISVPPTMVKADLLREARFFSIQPLIDELTYEPPEYDSDAHEGRAESPPPEQLSAAKVDTPPEIERYVTEYFSRHEALIADMIRKLNKEGHMNVCLQIIPGHRQDFERPPQLTQQNKINLFMNFTTLYITRYTRVQALLARCFKSRGFSGYFRPGELIELWWAGNEFKRESDIIYF